MPMHGKQLVKKFEIDLEQLDALTGEAMGSVDLSQLDEALGATVGDIATNQIIKGKVLRVLDDGTVVVLSLIHISEPTRPY